MAAAVPELQFHPGCLDDPRVQALLREHLQSAASLSPPESVHALDTSGLSAPGTWFWSLWADDATLVGMCALKTLNTAHAEIKSMRTASDWLRRGVGDAMMRHLLGQAEVLAFSRLSLETGSAPAYAPARRLYARHGFVACGPFADYVADPHSQFMTRRLDAAGPSLTG
ncbi:MAG: GNAT family N-acetyltransferase [Xanthomonadales bacterium]|nr:GNAT family N-acetyltransferase [Xanthomonadales bacterium]